MRLLIDHRTTYRFAEPQARLVQMLRMTPQNSHDQNVVDWRIDVDCDARMRPGYDGWGNAVTMLYAEGPLDGIEIAVAGEVVTSHSGGVLHGVAERLPPALFLRTTPTTADPAISAWVATVAGGAGRLPALHRINGALRERLTIETDRSGAPRDAAAAWREGQGSARELAQVFVAAARSLGTPARYVSGYALAEGDGHARPHGWAEAHVEGIGWVGFDPSTGRSPEEGHVRVAAALDAGGAAPVAGSRLGDGVESLDPA